MGTGTSVGLQSMETTWMGYLVTGRATFLKMQMSKEIKWEENLSLSICLLKMSFLFIYIFLRLML